MCSPEVSPNLTDLLLTALENPAKYVDGNVEQKETELFVQLTLFRKLIRHFKELSLRQ